MQVLWAHRVQALSFWSVPCTKCRNDHLRNMLPVDWYLFFCSFFPWWFLIQPQQLLACVSWLVLFLGTLIFHFTMSDLLLCSSSSAILTGVSMSVAVYFLFLPVTGIFLGSAFGKGCKLPGLKFCVTFFSRAWWVWSCPVGSWRSCLVGSWSLQNLYNVTWHMLYNFATDLMDFPCSFT